MPNTTILRLTRFGRLGNQMAQMMFVKAVQTLCQRRVEAEGYDLPDWGLVKPRSSTEYGRHPSVGSHLTRAKLVATMIDYFKPICINLDGIVLREGHLSSPADYLDLFPLTNHGTEVPEDRLLVNIRLGDISTPLHPDYGPLPISYYQYLVHQTNLQPIFMGELDESPYLHALRRTFPNAEYLPNMGVLADFQTIRRAPHIAIAVSSFSWIAAFLSNAQTIHIPVAGMIDPRVRPDIDMLPTRDLRFNFHELAHDIWRDRYSSFFAPQESFRPMPRSEVNTIKSAATRKTFVTSARIHLGLARRLAIDSWTHVRRRPLPPNLS